MAANVSVAPQAPECILRRAKKMGKRVRGPYLADKKVAVPAFANTA